MSVPGRPLVPPFLQPEAAGGSTTAYGCEVDLTDAELIEQSRVDAESFGLLYDRYVDRIHGFVFARLRDRAVAEDVTAEVFLKALKGLDTFRSASGSFSGWLYQIARNAIIDHQRALRPTVSLEIGLELGLDLDAGDPAALVEDQALDRVEVALVWEAVAELNAAQRTAVILRLGRDLPIAEIAGRMDRSEGAVKLLLHRGLANLRIRLQSAGMTR